MEVELTLQGWWSKTNVDIITRPASQLELTELEKHYDITLPLDFRDYLAQGAPVAQNWDAEDGNWWPLEQIRSVSEGYDAIVAEPIASRASRHLFFLDHMDWSWAWAISCAGDATFGRIALIGRGKDGYVADSFTEFVQRYTNDWASVSRLRRMKLKSALGWLIR